MDFKELNNGVKMPIQGFGVFQIPDATECERVVTDALAVGYRLIDTASVYGNERAVGMAIRKSGIPREELFITTKAWISEMGYERTLRALDTSLARLGLDYLDLYFRQPYDTIGRHRLFNAHTRLIRIQTFADDLSCRKVGVGRELE